jgi:predicted nucleic acid-binding protein
MAGATIINQMRIYLDVCCLNRPYDSPAIDRNRLEAEAVIALIGRIGRGECQLISSDALDREIAACGDYEKSELVRETLRLANRHVHVTERELERWGELMELGFRQMDALHLACAETAHADVFLSTDDKLLNKAKTKAKNLDVRVMNPLVYLTETMK